MQATAPVESVNPKGNVMATSWFLCEFKRDTSRPYPVRYCAVHDFRSQIEADGGDFAFVEVLGNHAIAKVRAEESTLAAVASAKGFQRIPLTLLTSPLSDLSSAQRNTIRNKIESLGYDTSEIVADLGSDIGSKTLGDVLRFIAKRRVKPRYDSNADDFVFDGAEQPTVPIDFVDGKVVDG